MLTLSTIDNQLCYNQAMQYEVDQNVSLAQLTTFKLGGVARYVASINSVEELTDCLAWIERENLKHFILSGGSNTVFGDDGFDGVIIRMEIKGFTVDKDHADYAVVKVGAGEVWDETVARCVKLGLSGIEALSLIPGLCGSAPVQNIGAYGQELSQTLSSVEALDQTASPPKLVQLSNANCHFSYRDSIFKSSAKGRYIITSITLKLSKQPPAKPVYHDLVEYFAQRHIDQPTLNQIRQAVIEIRQRKLPDPAKIPNAGSFFKNPIISRRQFSELARRYPELDRTPPGWSQPPRWEVGGNQIKLSAARLIELAGFSKGFAHGHAKIDDRHTLVLENIEGHSAADLFALKNEIINQVMAKFDIVLETEPVIVD